MESTVTNPTPHSSGRGRRAYTSGNEELDARLRDLVASLDTTDSELVFEILATATRLAGGPITRLDRKIANSALKEMRYAFSIFGAYQGVRKVTIFGSSRVAADRPEYQLAAAFARQIVERGWMVMTGAGPGIMEAGHEGAGSARSFGVGIRLPFEAKPNPVIAGDPKMINFKYFFTRKLMFIKYAIAFIIFPGGFGTMDELFEALTLAQTRRIESFPIILYGSEYWSGLVDWMKKTLVREGAIRREDFALFSLVDTPEEVRFLINEHYRVFSSIMPERKRGKKKA